MDALSWMCLWLYRCRCTDVIHMQVYRTLLCSSRVPCLINKLRGIGPVNRLVRLAYRFPHFKQCQRHFRHAMLNISVWLFKKKNLIGLFKDILYHLCNESTFRLLHMVEIERCVGKDLIVFILCSALHGSTFMFLLTGVSYRVGGGF